MRSVSKGIQADPDPKTGLQKSHETTETLQPSLHFQRSLLSLQASSLKWTRGGLAARRVPVPRRRVPGLPRRTPLCPRRDLACSGVPAPRRRFPGSAVARGEVNASFGQHETRCDFTGIVSLRGSVAKIVAWLSC